MKGRVLLAMSGGVDSSACAILLKNQGYEVIGATMQLLENDFSAVKDAKIICDKLQIEHHVLKCEEEFKDKVINNFIETYKKSETPNPCIECNKFLKFGIFFDYAEKLNCNYMATGHYARTKFDKQYNRYVIKKSSAKGKDQTYVLYGINKDKISKIIFPLADFENKEQIRKILYDYGLEVLSQKKDSQEICFIKDNDYSKFILDNAKIKPQTGKIIDRHNNVLGEHKGLIYYTIGQRKGIGLSSEKPLYIIGMDKEKNQIIVGEEKDLYKNELLANQCNFLLDVQDGEKIEAKIRYSAKESKATLFKLDDFSVKLKFDEPQRAITKGQSVVFYDKDVLLGGGIIC